MDSIGATPLNIPNLDKFFISGESPVLSQKPIFFAIDPDDPVTNEIEKWDYSARETKDEFRKKVEQRKLHGFIGNEYTIEEAMSKQFGPEQIEARAFLEYYWEMKAKCLDAVEKKRNSEIEAYQSHPLFSPDWLVPTKRDIRWYLKNEIGNEKTRIVEEERLNGLKSPTLVKPRNQALGKNSSSTSFKRFPTTRDLARSVTERKKGMPLKEIRKPVDKSLPVSHKRFPANGNTEDVQYKRPESKKPSQIHLREVGEMVVRKKPSSVLFKRLLTTGDVGNRKYECNENRKGSKIPVKKF